MGHMLKNATITSFPPAMFESQGVLDLNYPIKPIKSYLTISCTVKDEYKEALLEKQIL